jgi:hypothetical protein
MTDLSPVRPAPPGLPEWIEPTFRFTPGVDPFGIRALTAGRIIAPLVPGILALSDRARYMSLFTWLLRRYADQHRQPTMAALSSYLLRREYEFALAVRLCPQNCGSSPVGMDRVGPVVSRHPAAYERGESVKSALGGYGLYYRTPMRVFELIRPAGTNLGSEAIPIDVFNRALPRASSVADAFERAVSDTAYVRDYMDADGPIPAEVLVDYASKACLCRLEEFSDERDLLRDVLLEPTDGQPADDVRSRRDALALFLDLLSEGAVDRSDAELRWAIWSAYEGSPAKSAAFRRTITRWAALTALNLVQDGINLLWINAGRQLRKADRGAGLNWADVKSELVALSDIESLDVLGTQVECGPNVAASHWRGAIASATRDYTLREVDLWAVGQRTAISGLALILAVLARSPAAEQMDRDWLRIAGVEGEWQPGLLSVTRYVDEQIAEGCTLGELLARLTEHLVVRAHESNAYSKLPDFTFRWRSEAGRLRFYDHPIDWVVLSDLRSSAMAGLLEDVGFCHRDSTGLHVTADGSALIERVFE